MLEPHLLRAFLRMFVEVSACVWAYQKCQQAALAAVSMLAVYHVGALAYRILEVCRRQPLVQPAEILSLPSVLLFGLGYWAESVWIAGTGLGIFGFSIAGSDLTRPDPVPTVPRNLKIGAKLLGMVACDCGFERRR